MFRSVTERVTRAVEVLLPKATADAACPPDPYTQCKEMSGTCFCRNCSTNGACKVVCGAWYSMSHNYC
ncbi:hypothetical protein ACFV2X_43505 [Streptomyces sp. NPDC059679]|uniref:hypothetical protein n=1 Tax=unclassified Streptomyces TaxID=2593676 RepID=UPI00299BC3A3|nr:hypothetical protein [Streptomyces sp. FXJ1.4098]